MSRDIKPANYRPIGYWLKQLDRLIEDTFSRTLSEQGLTRRHWQVLNTLARDPAGPAELTRALDPFLRDDPAGQAEVVAGLIRRDWVTRDHDGRLRLTGPGRTAHQRTQEQSPANPRADASRRQRRRIHHRHRHPRQDGGQPRDQPGLNPCRCRPIRAQWRGR
jgi:hypothetical protein